nr:hypothetical protein CFP56_73691 [Quercus suber]
MPKSSRLWTIELRMLVDIEELCQLLFIVLNQLLQVATWKMQAGLTLVGPYRPCRECKQNWLLVILHNPRQQHPEVQILSGYLASLEISV